MTEPRIIATDPITVAFITMHGPYTQTPEGLERLYGWVGGHGLRPAGPPMERYYSDPAEVPPEEYLTEIVMPVRKA